MVVLDTSQSSGKLSGETSVPFDGVLVSQESPGAPKLRGTIAEAPRLLFEYREIFTCFRQLGPTISSAQGFVAATPNRVVAAKGN
jgi:hypothetical protein